MAEFEEMTNFEKCAECGMPLWGAGEFHPYAACEKFKETHDSRIVRAMLRRDCPAQADRHVSTGQLLGGSRGR